MMIAPPSRAVEQLGALLSHHTGQELTESRRWRIETSLRPLLRARNIASLDALLLALEREPRGALLSETLDAMLNHESSFFRDIGVFRNLEEKILPQLAAQSREKVLRIWCAGCSTGQEAYSLAMMVRRMEILRGWRVTIRATDISEPAIMTAQQGRYSRMDMQRGLPIGELLRWFEPVGADWQIADEIRNMVSFHADNLLTSSCVPGVFDLILCRNLLFYFPERLRPRARDQLALRARAGSYLVLGAGELLPGQDALFTNCRDMSCVYVAGRLPKAA